MLPHILLLWGKIIDLVWPLTTPRHYGRPKFSSDYTLYIPQICGFNNFSGMACAHQNMLKSFKDAPPHPIQNVLSDKIEYTTISDLVYGKTLITFEYWPIDQQVSYN